MYKIGPIGEKNGSNFAVKRPAVGAGRPGVTCGKQLCKRFLFDLMEMFPSGFSLWGILLRFHS
jgi:hypothetical protein